MCARMCAEQFHLRYTYIYIYNSTWKDTSNSSGFDQKKEEEEERII